MSAVDTAGLGPPEAGVVGLGVPKVGVVGLGVPEVGVVAICAWFFKDPPKNWWPAEIDPLNYSG
ncbi:hypothetical protein ABZ554_37285, partial [Streptomyces sp. NPDC020125]|uniref:hypothetical protein n=1 Tax=Streptomyces sp. NPDC020125 TaxID=3154593 RepID=UPI0033F1CD62